MKFLLYLVIFFLLLNGFATAQSLIGDSCKKAAARSPKINVDFCVKSLEAIPRNRKAPILAAIVYPSMKNAAAKLKSLTVMVDKILMEKKFAKDGERPLRDCLGLYTTATASLNQAMNNGTFKYASAAVLINAAVDAPTKCETGFKPPQKSPLTKENDVLSQTLLIPLAFLSILIKE